MQAVLLTPTFQRQADEAGLIEDEVMEIVSWLAANPTAGQIVVGTGGARKVRFARRKQGKSGGYRTIHYFGGDDVPVFLLGLIDKRSRADLSQAERNELAKLLPRIAEAYRRGAQQARSGEEDN